MVTRRAWSGRLLRLPFLQLVPALATLVSLVLVPAASADPAARGAAQRPATQAASLVYGDTAGVSAYAGPGALVVAGRDNYDDPELREVADAGGTVLIYLDPIIDATEGRYHELLLERSTCGPAVPRWPGEPVANSYGHLNDFRPGSVLQDKLRCVLETMVDENPHMAGWFADDVGSRSWFPGFSWADLPAREKQAYRDGAIEITRTFREVADEHGLIFLVNGSWGRGTLDRNGGGYPNPEQHGNALADGGFVEHHDGRTDFFGRYACSPQWARESPVTRGSAVNYTVTNTWSGLADFARTGCFAWASVQREYSLVPPWSEPVDLGLPSGSRR